jgi:hypothetical protein
MTFGVDPITGKGDVYFKGIVKIDVADKVTFNTKAYFEKAVTSDGSGEHTIFQNGVGFNNGLHVNGDLNFSGDVWINGNVTGTGTQKLINTDSEQHTFYHANNTTFNGVSVATGTDDGFGIDKSTQNNIDITNESALGIRMPREEPSLTLNAIKAPDQVGCGGNPSPCTGGKKFMKPEDFPGLLTTGSDAGKYVVKTGPNVGEKYDLYAHGEINSEGFQAFINDAKQNPALRDYFYPSYDHPDAHFLIDWNQDYKIKNNVLFNEKIIVDVNSNMTQSPSFFNSKPDNLDDPSSASTLLFINQGSKLNEFGKGISDFRGLIYVDDNNTEQHTFNWDQASSSVDGAVIIKGNAKLNWNASNGNTSITRNQELLNIFAGLQVGAKPSKPDLSEGKTKIKLTPLGYYFH